MVTEKIGKLKYTKDSFNDSNASTELLASY
jgi:hypothetical protein